MMIGKMLGFTAYLVIGLLKVETRKIRIDDKFQSIELIHQIPMRELYQQDNSP